MAEPVLPVELKAEVVYVYVGSNASNPFKLKSPRWTSMNGQNFLSGISLDRATGGYWPAGKTVHIPMNAIGFIIEVGDEAEHIAIDKKFSPKKKGFFGRK